MRDSVRAAFPAFTKNLEGRLNHMYLDVKGYVTTGIGNLIDSVSAAQALPWKRSDGSLATPLDIADEWQRIKARTDIALQGGGAYGRIATLHLTEDDLDALFLRTLGSFESTLKSYYPDFETWPADAQMAVLSMAWALGPAFAPGWPLFSRAVRAKDFLSAAENSHMEDTNNPGLRPRNAANLVMLKNAAAVEAGGGDPDLLYYPLALATPLSVAPGWPPDQSLSRVLIVSAVLACVLGALTALGGWILSNRPIPG